MTYNLLPTLAITAAIGSTTTTPVYTSKPFSSAFIKADFVGTVSGGTSVNARVQCSSDYGVTWHDLCDFIFANTGVSVYYNLCATTPVLTQATITDGSITTTAVDGAFTNIFRVKYVTVGVYAAATLTIWMFTRDVD
jgi:hypothetical protein